jgi:amidase
LNSLIGETAVSIVKQLRRGAISPLECLDALEARIGEVNAPINALVTLCFDRARSHAKAVMSKPVMDRGLLAGLPVPIKDLTDVAGVRSTQGSTIFAKNIAQTSDILVRHLEKEGGIVYAMSNTPEFGAGGHTFNEVFGVTCNPWNTKLSAAGSSGGAAAAIASGMAWVAHGSDMGGSLRNPASFCGIVGMRPSPGRVAASVFSKIDGTLGVEGPMARNVADLALLFDAMTGFEAGDPLSLPRETASFSSALGLGWRPKRVAVSTNLGITPVDREVAQIVLNAARKLQSEGVIVEDAHPDLSVAMDCFQILRAQGFSTGMRQLLIDHPDQIKPEVIWNIEKGLALNGDDIARAESMRGVLFRNMHAFLNEYDFLLCPTTIVPPFPIQERYVKSCDGVDFATYVDWLLIVGVATLCACPAISIPCGFTNDKLPIGLQVIAPNRGEAKLLAGAQFMESVFGLGTITPIDPR